MNRIIEYCIKQQMLADGDGVVVGLSGGADSVCLLHALLRLQESMHLRLLAVHVHHGIRGASADLDARFAGRLCEQLKVEYHEERADVPAFAKAGGLTLEEAGRRVRYGCFLRLMEQRGYKKLAVAHHQNDLAETMLFHMVRGTGLSGLVAMTPVTALKSSPSFRLAGAELIRPLLGVTKSEIEDILGKLGIAYCTDETNEDTSYSRNYIRREVVERLTHVNSQAVSHMAALSGRLSLAQDFLAQKADEAFRACVSEEVTPNKRFLHIDCRYLETAHPYIQQELVKRSLVSLAEAARDIQAVHIEHLLLLKERKSGRRIQLPYGITAWKGYGELILETACAGCGDTFSLAVLLPQKGRQAVYALPWGQRMILERIANPYIETPEEAEKAEPVPPLLKIGKKSYTNYFDCDKIENSLVLRHPQPEDYFVINRIGNRKLLRRYFIDEKVPAFKRGTLPVLADGHHVLWIPGYRMSEYYKVTEHTGNVLKLSFENGVSNVRESQDAEFSTGCGAKNPGDAAKNPEDAAKAPEDAAKNPGDGR